MDLDHMMVEMRGKRKKTISLNNVWISGGEKFHFLCLTCIQKINTAGFQTIKKSKT
jgi:hypothetical protein